MDDSTPSVQEAFSTPRSPSTHVQDEEGGQEINNDNPHGLRFWLIIASLTLATTISTLDGSITTTALPTIVHELSIQQDYVWIINIYFLTTAAFQPLFGQLSDLFGRRWILISTLALLLLGSGLCGGASDASILIAARAIQGVGAGGITMMADLVICDLVPLRTRGKYIGIMFGTATAVGALGPLFGGALTNAGAWRWIFYINLPIGGTSLALMLHWLRLSHPPTPTLAQCIRCIDWIGALLIITSTVSILYALAYGGSFRSWSDSRVLVPLAIGHVGLALFAFWQAVPQCSSPLIPPRIFGNRTSAAALFLTFTNCLLAIWSVFTFPLYFQAVLEADPYISGLWLLPLATVFPVAAAVAGAVMARTGRYRELHFAGFALCTLGAGLCSTLDENSNTASWIIFQILFAIGVGIPISCLLPAVQASLSDKDNATSAGIWAFVRSLGTIWGATIPAAVFNSRFEQLLYKITDADLRQALAHGRAYAQTTSLLAVGSLTDDSRWQVLHVYAKSLQRVWQICTIFAGISFFVVFIERKVTLRKSLDSDFGLERESTEAKA